jgi:hypothetical protein
VHARTNEQADQRPRRSRPTLFRALRSLVGTSDARSRGRTEPTVGSLVVGFI